MFIFNVGLSVLKKLFYLFFLFYRLTDTLKNSKYNTLKVVFFNCKQL